MSTTMLASEREACETSTRAQGPNVGQAERWGSFLLGALLGTLGLRRRGAARLLLLGSGGTLALRALTGHCYLYEALGIRTAEQGDEDVGRTLSKKGVKIRRTFTVQAPAEKVYSFLRDLENLPRFLSHVRSVTTTDNAHSHWVVEGPFGLEHEWDAEIINDEPGRIIAWRTLAGSQVDHSGSAGFKAAPGGRGTELRVELKYNPPSGLLGIGVAKLFGQDPEKELDQDLRELKQLLESGEIATTSGQPGVQA